MPLFLYLLGTQLGYDFHRQCLHLLSFGKKTCHCAGPSGIKDGCTQIHKKRILRKKFISMNTCTCLSKNLKGKDIKLFLLCKGYEEVFSSV